MEYFGTYTNNQDLVPKSYVDSYVNSHSENNINVVERLTFKGNNWDWDNYDNAEGDVTVDKLKINCSSKSILLHFIYDSEETGKPNDPSDVPHNPSSNTIYYILSQFNNIQIGSSIYLYLRAENCFLFDYRKIKVRIPGEIEVDNGSGIINTPVYFNGRYLEAPPAGSSLDNYNGYVDLGYVKDEDSRGVYSISSTLHIYYDGTVCYIDRYPTFNTNA